MSIAIHGLSLSYEGQPVLRDMYMELPSQGVAAVVGPSGCGKSSLLFCLAGLRKPDQGVISGSEGMRISMVFQEDRLLPWANALDNVLLVNPDDEAARQALDMVELTGEDIYKLPDQLSGGMRRRAAIARAVSYGGDILLLDEPDAGLDQQLARRIMARLRERWQGKLIVLVTHDLELAESCADRVFQM